MDTNAEFAYFNIFANQEFLKRFAKKVTHFMLPILISLDAEILKRAATDVARSFKLDDFKPAAVVIITWSNVTFYGGTSNMVRI